MLDHAVIVPTAQGPVGAVVTEPEIEQRGAFILLQGGGPPCRAGVNAIWTHIARDLAGLGLAVLRFDFACEGDSTAVGRDVPRDSGWRRCVDLGTLRHVAPWFLERSGERQLFLAGDCYGARLALEFAASDTAAAGIFLLTPYLWHREPHLRDADEEDVPPSLDGLAWSGGPTLDNDEDLREGFRTCLTQGPVWVLTGPGDDVPVLPFLRQFASFSRPLELEVAPGMPLHPVSHPAQQATVKRRLLARVERALVEREGRASSALG